MTQKTSRTLGWVLTVVLSLLFAFSAFLKITENEGAIAQAASMGITKEVYWWIGIIELVSLVLFCIPRTGIIGLLLLIAYMGGAIASHVQHQQPVAVAVTVQVLLWITAWLRFPSLFRSLFSGKRGDFATLKS
ncbi:MAG: DoxX family protein [Chitinophagaceae bacterium]|nr:DoxX family protein [Chitinophagaceae bacterium]MCW5926897.1 DoxX family protein [Chitinophagaceae bacterium]